MTTEAITKEYLKELLEPLAKSEHLVSLENRIAELTVTVVANSNKIVELENKVTALETDLASEKAKGGYERVLLQSRVEELEQYGRRTSLRLSGIRYDENETNELLTNKVIKCFRDLDVQINRSDLFRLHRIGRSYFIEGVKYQQVIIKFHSWNARCNAYNGRFTAAEKEEMANVFVNLDLTKQRYSLLKQAKEALTESSAYSYVDINCRLVIKKGDEKMFFNTENELREILGGINVRDQPQPDGDVDEEAVDGRSNGSVNAGAAGEAGAERDDAIAAAAALREPNQRDGSPRRGGPRGRNQHRGRGGYRGRGRGAPRGRAGVRGGPRNMRGHAQRGGHPDMEAPQPILGSNIY